MWKTSRIPHGGVKRFFSITLGHETAASMYMTNFNMIQHKICSLTEIEAMLPYEREIYIALLNKHIEEENRKIEAMKSRGK